MRHAAHQLQLDGHAGEAQPVGVGQALVDQRVALGQHDAGGSHAFKIVGELTIRKVTKEVSFDTRAKIVGDTLTGTAVLKFNMTDFGFDPPAILFVLKAENAVELTLQIEAKRTP